MKRHRVSARGFTLVELLMSLVLAMVGLLGLLALQLIANRGNMSSRNFAEATGLAQERIEALKPVFYANLPTQALTESNVAPSPGQAVTQNLYYKRTTAIAVNAVNGYTDVTVTVSWNDIANAGKQHQVVVLDRRRP